MVTHFIIKEVKILTKYQVNLPYPIVTGLQHNYDQAKMLIEGYSGSISELTTVSQYAYHKVKCNRYKEIYDTLEGIFLVETLHLELLGDCINQLGVDPRYYITPIQKISWTSNFVDYKQTPSEMILADINGEIEAAQYYLRTAQKIENNKIEPLLLRLAEDEKLHVRIFSDIYRKYFNDEIELLSISKRYPCFAESLIK